MAHLWFADMAADTSALLDNLQLSNVDMFGWSDCAIIGLHLAPALARHGCHVRGDA